MLKKKERKKERTQGGHKEVRIECLDFLPSETQATWWDKIWVIEWGTDGHIDFFGIQINNPERWEMNILLRSWATKQNPR